MSPDLAARLRSHLISLQAIEYPDWAHDESMEILPALLSRIESLEAALREIIRLNDTLYPSGDLDAVVTYRAAERAAWQAARRLVEETK